MTTIEASQICPKTQKAHYWILDHESLGTCQNCQATKQFSNFILRLTGPRPSSPKRQPKRPSKSGYRGVSPNTGKWAATICVDGKVLYIGRFEDPKAAALAYNEAAVKHFGDAANLNEV